VRCEEGVCRRRHWQLQEGEKACLEFSKCTIDCIFGVGGAGRGWQRFGWGVCNHRCCWSVGLVAVIVMVAIIAVVIIAAAIIMGTKRKLFYGCGYSAISTVSC